MDQSNDIDEVLKSLRERFSHLTAKEIRGKIKETFAESNAPKKSKYHQVQLDLDDSLSKIKDIPKATFTKLAKDAWDRKYPDGRESRLSSYAEFLKEKLPELRRQNPQSSHPERIKQAAILWDQYKKEQGGSEVTKDTMDIEDEVTTQVKPKSKRSKNKKETLATTHANQSPSMEVISEDNASAKKIRTEGKPRRVLRSNTPILPTSSYIPDSMMDFPPLTQPHDSFMT